MIDELIDIFHWSHKWIPYMFSLYLMCLSSPSIVSKVNGVQLKAPEVFLTVLSVDCCTLLQLLLFLASVGSGSDSDGRAPVGRISWHLHSSHRVDVELRSIRSLEINQSALRSHLLGLKVQFKYFCWFFLRKAVQQTFFTKHVLVFYLFCHH